MNAVCHLQVPGKPTRTSASTSRITDSSGPPRARMARSTSGRGAQAASARLATTMHQPPRPLAIMRVLPTLGPRMMAMRVLGLGAIACLAACRRPPARVAEAEPPLPSRTYDATLKNGFLSIHVQLPFVPEGRKPIVISPVADARAYLKA